MKKFTKIQEKSEEQKPEEELRIIELSYFDFINICDIYKPIDYVDGKGLSISEVVDIVKDNPEFSKQTNKYHYLVAVKDKKLLGVFYKQLSTDTFGLGYLISKDLNLKLLQEMKKIGPFITYTTLKNIKSIINQLKLGADVICISENEPKEDGSFTEELTEKTRDLLINEKIYYVDGDEKFFFYNENEELQLNELKNFLFTHEKIKLIDKSNVASKIKIFFLFTT